MGSSVQVIISLINELATPADILCLGWIRGHRASVKCEPGCLAHRCGVYNVGRGWGGCAGWNKTPRALLQASWYGSLWYMLHCLWMFRQCGFIWAASGDLIPTTHNETTFCNIVSVYVLLFRSSPSDGYKSYILELCNLKAYILDLWTFYMLHEDECKK